MPRAAKQMLHLTQRSLCRREANSQDNITLFLSQSCVTCTSHRLSYRFSLPPELSSLIPLIFLKFAWCRPCSCHSGHAQSVRVNPVPYPGIQSLPPSGSNLWVHPSCSLFLSFIPSPRQMSHLLFP